jgi:hypothetical protein
MSIRMKLHGIEAVLKEIDRLACNAYPAQVCDDIRQAVRLALDEFPDPNAIGWAVEYAKAQWAVQSAWHDDPEKSAAVDNAFAYLDGGP